MAKVLIVGLGYVGLKLAEELIHLGHQVTGLCRSDKQTKADLILKDLHTLQADDLPKQLEYVFYMVSANSRSIEDYQLAYPRGVKRVLECLGSQAIKRFFYISSTGVYPNSVLTQDEQTKIIPPSKYAEILCQAEELAFKSNMPATVVRFGGLYGPGRNRLIQSVKEGRAHLSDKPIFTNRIHQSDAAGMLTYLMERENLEDIYNGVDGSTSLYNEVITWLANQLSVSLPSEPKTLNRPSKKISNDRLLAAGYPFKYPSFKEGYLDVLDETNKI